MRCQSHGCDDDADGAFTWPGRPVQPACMAHMASAHAVARALGFELPFVPLALLEEAAAAGAVALLTRDACLVCEHSRADHESELVGRCGHIDFGSACECREFV